MTCAKCKGEVRFFSETCGVCDGFDRGDGFDETCIHCDNGVVTVCECDCEPEDVDT